MKLLEKKIDSMTEKYLSLQGEVEGSKIYQKLLSDAKSYFVSAIDNSK